MSLCSPGTRVFAVLAAAFVLLGGIATPALAAEKQVDVSVTVTGNVEGITEAEVESLAEGLLAGASVAVTDGDGPDVIELHLNIHIDEDGQGYSIHFEAGAWSADQDFESEDDLDEILTAEFHEFIEVEHLEDEEEDEP
jgi:hypothetical protein